MKITRSMAIAILLLAGLAACSLPGVATPAASGEAEAGTSPAPVEATLTSTPKPPTATPEPEVWFSHIQEGEVLTAALRPEGGIPVVTTQVSFTGDDARTARYVMLDADGMLVGRVKYDYLEGYTDILLNWTPWHGNGDYLLELYKINYAGTVISNQSLHVTVTGIPEGTPTIEELFEADYQKFFGLQLEAPVFAHFIDEDPERSAWNQWTSGAYIGGTFYRLSTYDESGVTGTFKRDLVGGQYTICRPAGEYEILVAVVNYGNTDIDHETVLEKLAKAEEASNAYWSEVSASLGQAEAILKTTSTITYIDEVPVAGELVTAEQVKALTGYDPADYDILAEVDLDLANRVPQSYGGGGVAFMNACKPGGADAVNMIVGISSQERVTNMTASLYDHELMHLLGWVHEWPDGDGSGRAQANEGHWFPYRLFGWWDTDGDGVLEILEQEPYGLLP